MEQNNGDSKIITSGPIVFSPSKCTMFEDDSLMECVIHIYHLILMVILY